MKELKIIQNVRLLDQDGIIMFNLADVAKKLGLTTVAKSGNATIRWSRVTKYLNDLGDFPKVDEDTMIEESVFYLLAMKANNKVAKKFQIKVATEIIPEYRKTTIKPMTQMEIVAYSAQQLVSHEKTLIDHNDRIAKLEAAKTTRPMVFTIAGYATLKSISVNLRIASNLGRKASKICREEGLKTDTCPDPRFGVVKMYPLEVLERVFEDSIAS